MQSPLKFEHVHSSFYLRKGIWGECKHLSLEGMINQPILLLSVTFHFRWFKLTECLALSKFLMKIRSTHPPLSVSVPLPAYIRTLSCTTVLTLQPEQSKTTRHRPHGYHLLQRQLHFQQVLNGFLTLLFFRWRRWPHQHHEGWQRVWSAPLKSPMQTSSWRYASSLKTESLQLALLVTTLPSKLQSVTSRLK